MTQCANTSNSKTRRPSARTDNVRLIGPMLCLCGHKKSPHQSVKLINKIAASTTTTCSALNGDGVTTNTYTSESKLYLHPIYTPSSYLAGSFRIRK